MSTAIAAPALTVRAPLYNSLFFQVLAALLLGIVLGMTVPEFATALKVLSDGFLKLISMIVAPIVFCVVVHGIAGAGDLKKVGRVGVKALIYFEVMTTIALCVGLLLAFLLGPGHGMNIDPSTLDAKALGTYADNAHKLLGGGVSSFILNIIPTTSIDALARNDVLQVLFFAILFGVALALVGEPAKEVVSLIDAVSTVSVQGHGSDRSTRAARCPWCGWLHRGTRRGKVQLCSGSRNCEPLLSAPVAPNRALPCCQSPSKMSEPSCPQRVLWVGRDSGDLPCLSLLPARDRLLHRLRCRRPENSPRTRP
jgi:hypothetical protein